MPDRALRLVVGTLALLGASLAGYLTYTRFTHAAITCTSGGCEAVQTSSYAELAGVPVSMLGLAAYLFILGTAFFVSDLGRTTGATVAVAAALFAAYLVYVQVAVIDALCDWCIASDALIALLALACVQRLRSQKDG
jgi:uncharacterized membrane protein